MFGMKSWKKEYEDCKKKSIYLRDDNSKLDRLLVSRTNELTTERDLNNQLTEENEKLKKKIRKQNIADLYLETKILFEKVEKEAMQDPKKEMSNEDALKQLSLATRRNFEGQRQQFQQSGQINWF